MLFGYLLKFGGCFCLFYFGTLAVIGLSSPGNFYSPFIAAHLNFVNPLRLSLLWGAQVVLSAFGFKSSFEHHTIALQTGEAVRIVYSCIGYGVMSFWAAFVIANKGDLKKKSIWIVGGLLALWGINVLRIVFILLGAKNQWPNPFGWDHHTWFNIAAYALIFGMIYFYDRSFHKSAIPTLKRTANQNTQAIS